MSSYVYTPAKITADNSKFNELMKLSLQLYEEIDYKHQKHACITEIEGQWLNAFAQYAKDITKDVYSAMPTKERY